MLLKAIALIAALIFLVKPVQSDDVMDLLARVERLQKRIESVRELARREYQDQSIYKGVVTTEGKHENVIYRSMEMIRCVGRKAILQISRGTRTCVGGTFVHEMFNTAKYCSRKAANSVVYSKGVPVHCLGSTKAKVKNGTVECQGKKLSDFELLIRCPISGGIAVRPYTYVDQRHLPENRFYWGNSGSKSFTFGYIDCDSGVVLSVIKEKGERRYCLGENVHIGKYTEGQFLACSDREFGEREYKYNCGYNGNLEILPVSTTTAADFAEGRCPGRVTAVKDIRTNRVLKYCIGEVFDKDWWSYLFCTGYEITVEEYQKYCDGEPVTMEVYVSKQPNSNKP